jgi:hypothetical protein
MSGRIIHGGRTGKGHRRRGAVIASWSCFPRIYGPEVRVCFLVKQLKPAKVGQHAYFESGTPNSRADGTQVIVGEGGSAGRLGTQPRFFHSCVFAICAALGESVCALHWGNRCAPFPLCVDCFRASRLGRLQRRWLSPYTAASRAGTSVKGAYRFAIPFAVLTQTGPGKFSLDRFIQRSQAASDFPVVKG